MARRRQNAAALLTLQEVAAYLRINKFTLYRLVAQRKIPAFKVGNQWRFNKNAIEAWLRKNKSRTRNPNR
ncbi:MAG: helix-turn-helix domain-containing protein [Candidatus Binatia bacterium]